MCVIVKKSVLLSKKIMWVIFVVGLLIIAIVVSVVWVSRRHPPDVSILPSGVSVLPPGVSILPTDGDIPVFPPGVTVLPVDVPVLPADVSVLPLDVPVLPADVSVLPLDVIPKGIYPVKLSRDTTCIGAKSACKMIGGDLASASELQDFVNQGGSECVWGYGEGCRRFLPSQGKDPKSCGGKGINESSTYYGKADHPCSSQWECPRLAYCNIE